MMTMQLGGLASYENKGKCALLRTVNILEPTKSEIVVLTPLHDDMRQITAAFKDSDAPDLVCPYYLVGFMYGSEGTGPSGVIHMVVPNGQTMFNVTRSSNDDGITINFELLPQIERLIQIKFPLARWKIQ